MLFAALFKNSILILRKYCVNEIYYDDKIMGLKEKDEENRLLYMNLLWLGS